MSYSTAFSSDYETARARFRSAVQRVGGRLRAYPIAAEGPQRLELCIDVATVGDPCPRRVLVVSSGLHGVEGFLGSAVQLALLENRLAGWNAPAGAAVLLLHALNPHGFAWRRRCNEDNVDLNRNFLLPGEQYAGSPPHYGRLDPLFNPPSPPRWFDLFLLKAAVAIWRFGMQALKETLPVGQYDYPRGLFFGGHGPTETHQILSRHLAEWLGDARDVVHLDFHTGLGAGGTYKLLLDDHPDPACAEWWREHFDAGRVGVLASDPGGIAYPCRGGFGCWCLARLADRRYRFAAAEFGTYSVIPVVAALRAENRTYHYLPGDHPACERAKRRLLEVFAPAAPRWRETAVRQGLDIVERAMTACFVQE